jgi:hypothetical protein
VARPAGGLSSSALRAHMDSFPDSRGAVPRPRRMVAMFPRVADITGIRERRCRTFGASGIRSSIQFPGAGARLRGGWRPRRAGCYFFSMHPGQHHALGAARYRLGCGKLACVATVGVRGIGMGPSPLAAAVLVRSLVAASPLACLCPQRAGRSRCMARAAGLECSGTGVRR